MSYVVVGADEESNLDLSVFSYYCGSYVVSVVAFHWLVVLDFAGIRRSDPDWRSCKFGRDFMRVIIGLVCFDGDFPN